jgi:hypothetical protein
LIVVKGKDCSLLSSSSGIRGATGKCQGQNVGYDASKSSTNGYSFVPFASNYGSGGAQGHTVKETVNLGGYEAKNILISVADKEAARFSGFKFDGIFGLAQQATVLS